jgi:hypothetical protein
MTAVVSRPAPPAPAEIARPMPRMSGVGATRGWAWPAVATLLGVAGALAPLPTLALLVGVAMVTLAVVAPRATAGITALVVLFVRPLEHLVPIPQVGYLDEALVLLCLVAMPLRRVVAREPLRTFPGQWAFAGFLVCGVLSGLVLHVPLAIFLTGAFIIAKGPLFAWAVAQIDWNERHLAVAARVGAVVIVGALTASLANVAMPATWDALLSSDANASEARSFLPSLIGPFTHPIDLGQFMAFSFVAVVTWRAAVRKSSFTLVLLVSTALVALATARRTAAGGLVVAWLWVQAKVRSTAVIVALLACVPMVGVVLAAPLAKVATATYQDYVTNPTPEARTVLTIDSFKVAAEHFPGGAGFGRFGSAVAAANYSPEYIARDYPTIWGLGRTAEDGRFLTDTEWPAIIGESGFFGALAFALGLIGVYRTGRRLWTSGRSPLVRWAGLMLGGWLIASLVQSVATVTFTGPPVFGLLFGLVGVVAALSDTQLSDPAVPPERTDPSAESDETRALPIVQ